MLYRQRGATLIGWLFVLLMIAALALVTVRLAPVYIEAYTVGKILEEMARSRDINPNDRAAVYTTLTKRLNVNNIDRIKRENITLQPSTNGLEVTVDYEARVPIVGNLDAVAHFRNKVILRN